MQQILLRQLLYTVKILSVRMHIIEVLIIGRIGNNLSAQQYVIGYINYGTSLQWNIIQPLKITL